MDGMDEGTPRGQQTPAFSRSARTKRDPDRLGEGFGYDEIAGRNNLDFGLSA